MKIVVLSPLPDATGEMLKPFCELLEKEVDMTGVEVDATDDMPEPIVYRNDMPPAASGMDSLPLIIPSVMKKAKALEQDGADAIVSACILGPGMPQARQVVDIPVLDPGEVAMHTAAMLGQKFAILAPGLSGVKGFQENILSYRMENQVASILSTDIDPASYVPKERETMDILLKLSIKAIEEDDASVIILGCGMMTGKGKDLKRLLDKNSYDVTVIQPIPLAVEFAKTLVKLNLKQTRLVPANYNYQF
jgi:allantoin racemase